MKFLECKGTPREIGRQQGEALREMIHGRWEEEILPLYTRVQEKQPSIPLKINRVHERMLGYLGTIAPEIIEEMRGLSEAARLPFDQIVLLSTYNALLIPEGATGYSVDRIEGADGCSALAFSDSPAGSFVMKTYDPFGTADINTVEKRREKAEKENHLLYVVKAAYEPGMTILGVRMAGSIWTEAGVNREGLGFAAASLHPRLYPQQSAALPQHCLGTLAITRCRSTAEVRALLAKVPVFGKGYATAFGDSWGHCVGIEKTGNDTGFNPPQLGIAYQTNHIRSEALFQRALEQDPVFWSSRYFQNSHNRIRRIEHQLARWSVATDFDSLIADLFHAGTPGDLIQNCAAACQHWITTWAALVHLPNGELWVAEGLPEERIFQKWKI